MKLLQSVIVEVNNEIKYFAEGTPVKMHGHSLREIIHAVQNFRNKLARTPNIADDRYEIIDTEIDRLIRLLKNGDREAIILRSKSLEFEDPQVQRALQGIYKKVGAALGSASTVKFGITSREDFDQLKDVLIESYREIKNYIID